METLKVSAKERRRLEVVSRVRDGELTIAKGAELMKLSYRQARRVYRRYVAEGDAGVVHRLRGVGGNRARDPAERDEAVRIYRELYPDFGPTLAAEYLDREHGLEVDHETLRRWLMAEGVWTKRRRRSSHRKWRRRKDYLGELVQMDGSYHDWFEGRRKWAVLMVMVDDATSRTYARFFESETTKAAFEVFGLYAVIWGLPRALYVDADSIYRTTRDARADEELRAAGPQTQFGRAMRCLDVDLIVAGSPQAKGRVERRNGVLQDRLVKALRVRGIDTLEEANRYLDTEFLAELNDRFTVEASEEADLHRRVKKDVKLDEVLCFEEPRVVRRDWTISWRRRWFQLGRRNEALGLVGRKITVREKLDGTVKLVYRGHDLTWHELPGRPESRKRDARKPATSKAGKRWKPPKDHPWRRGSAGAPPLSKPSSATLRQASTAAE